MLAQETLLQLQKYNFDLLARQEPSGRRRLRYIVLAHMCAMPVELHRVSWPVRMDDPDRGRAVGADHAQVGCIPFSTCSGVVPGANTTRAFPLPADGNAANRPAPVSAPIKGKPNMTSQPMSHASGFA